MKFIYIHFLLLLSFIVSADPTELLNGFFKNNLKFTQTSFNSANNSFDKSYGTFYRDLENNIKIEITSPFKEIYLINKNGVEIHDLEFNQKRFIENKDISNNLLNFIKNGFDKELLNLEQINSKNLKLIDNDKTYYFEFLNNDELQIKYKDNLNVDNLINFSKHNDK